MCTKRIFIIIVLFLCSSSLWGQYRDYQFSTLAYVARGSSSASPEDVASAQFEMGSRYYYGNGGAEKDLVKSHYWMLKSANGGDKYAQNVVGWNFYKGEGTDINKRDALIWFEKSGLQHYHESSLQAGKMYYFGEGTAIDYKKAARLFKDAAFGEIPEGMYYYALCFANGRGVQVDSTKAILWANRALDKDYNWTYWLLGHMYDEGLAVKKNGLSAKYYFEKGDELNISSCQNDLGVAYASGSFVEKDMEKAMDYFYKAANNGSTVAMENLATNYGRKDSGVYDPSQAVIWYRKLVDGGNDKYVSYLISLYEEMGDYRDAIALYEEQANKGDTSSLDQLAYFYALGTGVNKDFDKALSYIERAITLAPGNMYYQDSKGEILVMKGDIKKAKKVWRLINSTQPSYYQNWIEKYGKETPFYTYMKQNWD